MILNPNLNHTDKQKAILNESYSLNLKIFTQLINQAKILNDACVEVGTLNEEGKAVRSGANRDLISMRDQFISAANSISYLYNNEYCRDYYCYVRYRLRYLENRFMSENEYIERYSHLDKEILRLKNLNNFD